MKSRQLTECVRSKIREGIERTHHLIQLVPVDRLDWRPKELGQAPAADLGHLLGHLLDCVAGFCAALFAAFPAELEDFSCLRQLPVNHSCAPEDARDRIKLYLQCIERGFEVCDDAALGRKVPTVFLPDGEELLTLLLGNLEHLTNHKYQLFDYLKALGVRVATADLYRMRGAESPNTEA